MPESSAVSSETKSLPFAGCEGKGVRIAIIDSGVNERHPHISALSGGICVEADGSIAAGDYTDVLGHGTAVTAAIQEKAPLALYFAVRLFRDSLRTNADGLFNAIDWAIDQGMDVINLSLGTRNDIHVPRLERAVQRAWNAGALIVAARDAHGEKCYPGSLSGVISVGLDWDIPRETYRYDSQDGGAFYASGYPRALPGVSQQKNLNGISFAVANMSGFVLRACESVNQRSAEAVKRALVANL